MTLRPLLACLAAAALGLTLTAHAQKPPQLTPGTRFRDCPDCPELVVVPAGNFLMGSSDEELAKAKAGLDFLERWLFSHGRPSGQPQHEVSIKAPFAVARYVVTRGDFARFIQDTGYSPAPGCTFVVNHHYPTRADGSWSNTGFAQNDMEPVVCVSLDDANAYIAWLNQRVAKNAKAVPDGPYRLPSEAEWEYAARAGTTTARWWGDGIGVRNAVCDACGSPWDGLKTAPVDRFPDNPFGISGVLGNAFELTSDCFNADYRGAPIDGSSWSTGNCSKRVIRGGSAFSDPVFIRSSNRSWFELDGRKVTVGFRVVRVLTGAMSGGIQIERTGASPRIDLGMPSHPPLPK